eukprot:364213-Chlamydomonas_euryale.AAC.3
MASAEGAAQDQRALGTKVYPAPVPQLVRRARLKLFGKALLNLCGRAQTHKCGREQGKSGQGRSGRARLTHAPACVAWTICRGLVSVSSTACAGACAHKEEVGNETAVCVHVYGHVTAKKNTRQCHELQSNKLDRLMCTEAEHRKTGSVVPRKRCPSSHLPSQLGKGQIPGRLDGALECGRPHRHCRRVVVKCLQARSKFMLVGLERG